MERKSTIAAIILAMSIAGTAAGEPQAKDAKHHRFVKVCGTDIAKLCADTSDGDGDGAVASCLADKRSELTKPCLKAVRRAKRVSTFRQACGEDAKRLCAGTKPGGGRIVSCLQAADPTLSAACKELLAKVKTATGARAKEVADTASIADEAVKEEQQALPVLPESIDVGDQASAAAE